MNRASSTSSRGRGNPTTAKNGGAQAAHQPGTTLRDGPKARTGALRTAAASLPVVLVVALLLRVGFAWDYVRQNSHQALAVLPFLQESGNIAASLATGHGFSSPFRVDTGPTAWMTPVYPWLVSEIFKIAGVRTYDSFLAAVALNILCSAFTCIPIYFLGKRVAGTGVAAGTAWLWAVFPNTILNTFQSMWEASLAGLLSATILWATLALDESERRRDWYAYGLLWGLALMTSATLLSLLPLLIGWLAYRRWHNPPRATLQPRIMKAAFAKPALAAGIAVLCCVPWTIRNYTVFHEFVPFRSNLGLQLWLGNNENAQEAWREQLHPIFNSAERARYTTLGEMEYMHEKMRSAIRYMLPHPAREAQLIGNRFVATWSGGTPNPVKDFVHTPGLWFRGVLLFNILVACGTVAGIAVLWKRRSAPLFPIATFPIVFPWAYYLTLAYPRYRLPADPAVMLLTVVALGAIFRSSKSSSASSDYR